MTFEAGAKLLKAAQLREDDRIVCELSDIDPVAVEIRYHHCCYVKIYSKEIFGSLNRFESTEENDPYENVYAFITYQS